MNTKHPPFPSFRLAHYYREALGANAQRQWPDKDWQMVEPVIEALWVRNVFDSRWQDIRDEVRKAWIRERRRSRRLGFAGLRD